MKLFGAQNYSEEQCYCLLQYFSDTVLFAYDCNADVLYYSSNVSELFENKETVQQQFLATEAMPYVYPLDRELLKTLLTKKDMQRGEGEIRLLRPGTEDYFWNQFQVRYLFENQMITAVVGKITDVDRRKRQEKRLLKKAETDGLTSLQNKVTAEKRIDEMLRTKDRGLLFMIDIDNFKRINDVYGHTKGDQVLTLLANSMRRVFRSDDILGRVGGDEMMAFIGDTQERLLAQQKANLLFRYIEQDICSIFPGFSVSVGISCYPEDGKSLAQLHGAADRALYEAKRTGKNKYCFYDERNFLSFP